MANTLDAMRAVSNRPLYAKIELKDFHASLTGSIRVRVNLSKKMRREMLDAIDNTADNDAVLRVFAQLIPQSDTDDTPLAFEDFKTFLEGGDDTDDAFASWLIKQISDKVQEHFLVSNAPRKS